MPIRTKLALAVITAALLAAAVFSIRLEPGQPTQARNTSIEETTSTINPAASQYCAHTSNADATTVSVNLPCVQGEYSRDEDSLEIAVSNENGKIVITASDP
jgi:hypothetical protein